MRTKNLNIPLILTTILLSISLSGCGTWWLPRAHKIEIQQGNILTDEAVAKITNGMAKQAVVNILGEPVTSNQDNLNRWDYIYSVNRSGDRPNAKRLTVIFENDVVASLEKDGFDQ